MNVIWTRFCFYNLYPAFLLHNNMSQYHPYICSYLLIYDLPSVFRSEYYVILAFPFCVG